ALAELDLAGEHDGGAIGIDAQPGIEHAISLQAAGQPCCLLRQAGLSQRERNHNRAEAGAELPPCEHWSVHGQPLPLSWAARNTARMMRPWVPQRQRLPASAARTSSSLGGVVRSRSGLADMIMPLMQ